MNSTAKPLRWQGALEEGLARSLPAFLPAQRWFAGKARRIEAARAEDCVWLRDDDEPEALVVARVEYADGAAERYLLLVALRRDPAALPALGRLDVEGETRHLVEGAAHGPDALALLRHFDRVHALVGVHGGVLRVADVPAADPGVLRASALAGSDVRSLGAEQSNTSLRVGRGHVFKLFRRYEGGENPEVEIGRYLAAGGSFRAAPALRGSLSWTPSGGVAGTVGALSDRVDHQGDGWTWTLERLREVFARAASPEPLAGEIFRLGVVTAELHAALAARPEARGFAPAPATAEDVAAWMTAFRARAGRVLGLVAEGLDRLDAGTRDRCETILRLRSRLEAASALPEPAGDGAFLKIRLHGDYHLGQTLKVADGFALIDFEGEPSRPLAERRALHCALKDVAGMLRSFDYAIESARAGAPADGAWTAAPPPLRESFLRGYEERAAALGATFLPADPAARERWLAFFELDKALYELDYEIQNRPAWLRIPATGILRLLGEVAP